jgi:sulfur-oxidizing protein SoxY
MQAQKSLLRRRTMLAALAVGAGGRGAAAAAPEADDPWPALAAQIFNDRRIEDGSAVLALDAPYRAEDAAVVPIGIRLAPPKQAGRIRFITLVIDENPSPLAAKFTLAANSGTSVLSTRVRVDQYTPIHVVAETDSERLFATDRFVKAAGGCSAPAAKQEANAIPIGTMRLRQFPPSTGGDRREAQFMVRHPNNSGMQMDQITRLYVPAHFVTTIRLWQGDDLLLGVESGISISENPAFRFDYRPNGASEFRAEVADNEGGLFRQSWPVIRS